MGLPLIFAASTTSWLTLGWRILLVLIGVNLLILVHELGHFLVAKLFGVKCEKFYIWFDVLGWRLGRFRWGETEYGVGWLPLGGYVKMLGQEDNPARLREELERAKARQAAGGDPAEAKAVEDPAEGEPIDIEAAERALYDPRSYLAQSVPQRMAIISAGVVMNVIFAFVVAVLAYRLGVHQLDCGVGGVAPGAAAWRAGLQVGDRITRIHGEKVSFFAQLKETMTLGDIEGGVPLVIRRPGLAEPITVTVMPDRDGLAPTIGISPPLSTTLAKDLPCYPGSAAATAEPRVQEGDTIVRVGETPIRRYADYFRQEALHPEEPLAVTIQRAAQPSAGGDGKPGPVQRLTVQVPPRPMLGFGLIMEAGPITAVQRNSPAAEAGVRAGDRIVQINGEAPGDPLTLPGRLRNLALQTDGATLSLSRDGGKQTVDLAVRLRRADWYEYPLLGLKDQPVSAPAVGLAYAVSNRVAAVEEGSPAAKAGVRPGDVITGMTFIPPDEKTRKLLGLEDQSPTKSFTLEVGPGKTSWPAALHFVQDQLPATRVQFALAGARQVLIEPVQSPHWLNPDRGFVFEAEQTFVRGETLGESFSLGWDETVNALTMVLQFLRKIGSQVSARAIGGPVTIVQQAYYAVSSGMAEYMLFLCLISANLAVVNILPIPVLDGGHMIFLLYEGLRGKPPSERVYVGLSYFGLSLLLALMIWVFGLDFGLIPRQ